MDAVTLRLLGSAELLVGGAPARLDTRKAIAIAAYLAHEGTVARDSLCALLWPESDDHHARAALRRTLSSLRGAARVEIVVSDRRSATLAESITSDTIQFASAIDATRTHGHAIEDVCERCIPHLERAADLYAGTFLDGFSLRDAPEFEDWTRVVGEAYRGRMAAVLERLSTATAALGDYHRAVGAARRWVDLDALHEPAHRHLMLMSAWSGDRAGAIEAYRRCVAVLNGELGVSPLVETTELYEAILDEDLPPAPGQRRRVRAEPMSIAKTRDERFVGRSEPYAVLTRQLDEASGSCRVVVVEGQAWMGKTRLVERFVAAAAAGGLPVLLARAYSAERSLPHGVVVQLLRAAIRQGLLDAATLPEWIATELSRLLPEIGMTPDTVTGFGETRLFDAVASALQSAAKERVLVIGVDDAHWLDSASLSVLSYLSHRDDWRGLLLVLAGPRVTDFDDDAVRVRLGPLTATDLTELGIEPDEARRVIGDTGGVPLLVAEHLNGADPEVVTAGMQRYIDLRLRSLDELASQISAAASVLAGMCDIRLLRETSGRTEDETIEAADALIRGGILREVPGTASTLGFTLHAMQRAVYESLSPLRRRLLHRRAATALQHSRGAARDARVATAVADHLRFGGVENEAATWYVEAGDLSAALHAINEAEHAYRSALAMHHPDPGRVHFALGEVSLAQSRFRDAVDGFQAASALGDAGLAARAEHRLGEVDRRLGRFDQAEHHFTMAASAHPDPASLYADWALLDLRRGRPAAAERRAKRAVALAVAAGSPIAESRARDILGIVTEDASELERALALAGDDLPARMASLNSLAHAIASTGDADGAVPLVMEALDIAESIGDRHRRAALLNHLADLHYRSGRHVESRAALTDAVKLFADVQPDAWEPEVWLLTRW